MILDDLSSKYRSSMPGYDLVCEYEAGIPVFKVRLKVDVVRKQEVPPVAQFVLRLIHAGIDDEAGLAAALGMEDEFVREALVYLDRNQLVERRFDQVASSKLRFTVSNRGKVALEQVLSALTVDRIQAQVDGMTGEISPLAEYSLFEGSQLRKEGCWLLNASTSVRPTLDSLNQNIPVLQRILVQESLDSNQDREVVQVLDVERSWLMYARVNVLAFRNRNSERLSFRVFEGYEPNLDYDRVLARREQKGGRVVPDGLLVPLSEAAQPSQRFIDLEKRVDVQKIEQIFQRIDELEARQAQLAEEAELEDLGSVGGEEPANHSSKMEEITAEKEALLRQLPVSRHIRSNEHRGLLKDAFSTATERIFLISPCIKQDATDEEIINLMKKAIQRGVWIAIGYGMPLRYREKREDFIDKGVELALEKIRKQNNGNRLHVEWLGNTHEKILVCDGRFHVITSFNWLSYRGDQGFRHERGFYSEDPSLTADLCQDLFRSFKSLPDGFPGKVVV